MHIHRISITKSPFADYKNHAIPTDYDWEYPNIIKCLRSVDNRYSLDLYILTLENTFKWPVFDILLRSVGYTLPDNVGGVKYIDVIRCYDSDIQNGLGEDIFIFIKPSVVV